MNESEIKCPCVIKKNSEESLFIILVEQVDEISSFFKSYFFISEYYNPSSSRSLETIKKYIYLNRRPTRLVGQKEQAK